MSPAKRKGPVDFDPQLEIKRTRMPRGDEQLAIVIQMLGYDRVKAKCQDGHVRVCRIRGKMKKRVWIRQGDVIMIIPWDFQSDHKADVVWRYSHAQADFLKRRGLISED
ncbi:MAG: translation initiation factor eIF-1A [Candidatus Ranarchaeia archaeon]